MDMPWVKQGGFPSSRTTWTTSYCLFIAMFSLELCEVKFYTAVCGLCLQRPSLRPGMCDMAGHGSTAYTQWNELLQCLGFRLIAFHSQRMLATDYLSPMLPLWFSLILVVQKKIFLATMNHFPEHLNTTKSLAYFKVMLLKGDGLI